MRHILVHGASDLSGLALEARPGSDIAWLEPTDLPTGQCMLLCLGLHLRGQRLQVNLEGSVQQFNINELRNGVDWAWMS